MVEHKNKIKEYETILLDKALDGILWDYTSGRYNRTEAITEIKQAILNAVMARKEGGK